MVANWSEQLQWATLDLYRNESPESLLIEGNGDSDSWIVALGEFSGGGLWVEDIWQGGSVVG